MEQLIKILSVTVLILFSSSCDKQTENAVQEIYTDSENTEDRAEQLTSQTVESAAEQAEENTNLSGFNIHIGEDIFYAELYDTAAAEEFTKLLPITIDMSELNGNEKYYYIDEALTTDSKVPDMIHTGDIMLYGSSCIVLFYEDFSTSYSYTPIAHIEDTNGLKSALGSGNVIISFS